MELISTQKVNNGVFLGGESRSTTNMHHLSLYFTRVQYLLLMKPFFFFFYLYQIWQCEVNGFIRQQISTKGLCNALFLSWLGYISLFACYESIKLQGNRLAQAIHTTAILLLQKVIQCSATHWLCGNNLVPYGHSTSVDMYLDESGIYRDRERAREK